jgi:hypothetical protein
MRHWRLKIIHCIQLCATVVGAAAALYAGDNAAQRTESRATAGTSSGGKGWWSFEPVADPRPPQTRDGSWPRGEVDRFLLAKMEARGVRPAAPADRRTLIRRASFDLTGLPPTPEEVAAFLSDGSPDAFAKVVDRLLASPRYGERWGRHWLDVVRYADTAGDGADYPVREAYKYRDYVLQSFNDDVPYDVFLREQVAGDLLAADGPPEQFARRVTATGYLAIGKRFGYRPNNAFRHLDLADTIDVVGQSVLGLSVGCARCHDHKYDPVSTADYYALYGILDGASYSFPGGEEHQRPSGLVPLVPPAEREKLDAEWKAKIAELDAKLAALPKEPKTDEDKSAVRKLNRQRGELEADPPYPVAYAAAEGKGADARIQLRGEPGRGGDVVRRRFLKVLGGQTLPPDCKASGRLELAGWLTDPANPLTARVMVNRIWQHHFGRGIVATPNDFGTRGSPPTHPELLDWLASRFVRSGWKVKAMHRLIMLSAAYQMSGDDEPNAREDDPEDELLWRYPRRRLDAESIRDAMLAAGGLLDLSPAGPHPFPPVEKWNFTIHNPFYGLYETKHRSVYLMVQRQKRHPFLALFDGADPNVSTDQRNATVTPAQSLFLMNDPFVHECAAGVAKRVLAGAGDEAERVRLAFELTQAREPEGDDLVRAGGFLARYREKLAATGRSPEEAEFGAWSAYARVMLTSNAFLYVD